MKIVFRVDSSLLIGTGHVMRCLALADELNQKEYDITFACSPLEGDLRHVIQERGFKVTTLPSPQQRVIPTDNADYESWLQKDVIEDAQDFLSTFKSADLVITDHYGIGEIWQKRVKKILSCKLFAIDDLGRSHHADLILDQTLGRKTSAYKESKTQVLAGCEYALLHANFASKRELALSRKLSGTIPKVLISMGGIDAPNATLKILQCLYNQVDAEFTVLLPSNAPHHNQVKEWCALQSNVVHYDFVFDMASLMLNHDIAIGASGTTSWERACLGLPSIVLPLAENQHLITKQLVKNHAALQVNMEDIPERLLGEFMKLLEQWPQFKAANLALCDGRGARRVVHEIDQLFIEKSNGISLMRASKEDIALSYKWQCHPNTRRYSLTPHVPTWNEHQAWMSKKLKSISDYFYIIIDREQGKKVGAVRLDRMRVGHYLISIFLAPQSYGKGFAFKALHAIDVIHSDITLHATVLEANAASYRLFQKACYQRIDQETYIRKPID